VSADLAAAGLTLATTAPKADSKATAAKQLEAFFLRRLLSESRPKGGLMGGGFAGETFEGMLDEALADKMSSAGGVGLAKTFARQLGPKGSELADFITPAGMPRMEMPVAGSFTSGYGPRVGHGGETHVHQGVDLAARLGAPVTAAAPGVVEHAGPAGTYGNLVTVRHDNGFTTRYAHLSTVGVKPGDRVTAGQALGAVGSTGLSDGPHLHFEIRKGSEAIDPTGVLPLNRSATRTSR
jgi:murein DD-endopeptidase MepM/ murein hydrolase activator NlpD